MEWRLVAWDDVRPPIGNDADSAITVYSFTRRNFMSYVLFPFYAKRWRLPAVARKVLYINDGLLSSLFDSKESAGYRIFAAHHLPRPNRLRQRLIALLPLSLRADRRFVVVGGSGGDRGLVSTGEDISFERQNFMFYSNAPGKLLLTNTTTLRSGTGWIIKTTANPAYAEVMDKEFSLMKLLADECGEDGCLPRPGRRIAINGRLFFTEEYVKGESLREDIRKFAYKQQTYKICSCLDQLDGWFRKYCAGFTGEPQKLAACYEELFKVFTDRYGARRETQRILACARQSVIRMDLYYRGIGTITAHNDLWPGNFVVTSDRLVAVDWERAVGNRAPLFDYYWMIISATLEFLASYCESFDYSAAFRIFLADSDDVSRHAHGKLKDFLGRNALDRKMHSRFLLLFLMEWSVQGYLTFGRETAMDRLAYGELLNYADLLFNSPTNRRAVTN
ncbi:hypothetical protein GURASL_19820 [Geotalea uraniireducens]|uniref:Aminoglycoside phosphotransferase domain-containing protein n=1 Tax=Geotalea uraniireducens TaxID=351604 RepID=A0ABM8EKJ0_9BACT|nr:hypothetical protein GURASL_19820 [Geotalea uraniireducens]